MSDFANTDLLTAELVQRHEGKDWLGRTRVVTYIFLCFKYGAFEKFKVDEQRVRNPQGPWEVVLKQWHTPERFKGMEQVLKRGFEGNGRS